MIRIQSNGSKWAGEPLDTIEDLYAVLATETLDPRFEDCGNFITMEGATAHLFGNFYTVSHVFNLDTDEPETIQRLTSLIRANQATPAYTQSQKELAEHKKFWDDKREAQYERNHQRAIRALRAVTR